MSPDTDPAHPAAASERAALALLVALGFGLRIRALGVHGITADEAQFVWYASAETLGEVWRHVQLNSPHPPAHFFALHAILEHTWSPFWLRLPAALSGTALIALAHVFTRRLFGPLAALAAAGLVALAPSLVDLSRVARNYAPGFALFTASLVFLVAFARTQRQRDGALFGLLAATTVFWHYAFVVAYAGLGLGLAALLWWQRSPLATWLRTGASALPLLAALLFLGQSHVAGLGELIASHREMHAPAAQPEVPLVGPYLGLWHYLLWGPAAVPFAVLSLVAVADLWIRRRIVELLLCTTPILAGAIAGMEELMPFGEKRQSAYLFPFLFALTASQLPQLLHGYADTRRALRSRGDARPADTDATRVRWPGVVVVTALTALLLVGTSRALVDEAGFDPFGPARHREAMASHPAAGVERAFALLAAEAGERDWVVLDFRSLYATRLHFRLRPLLAPTPEQVQRGDLRLAHVPTSLHHFADGVHFAFPRGAIGGLDPIGLLEGVRELQGHFRLPPPERVWTLRSARQLDLAGAFRRRFPELGWDADVHERSGGMLFAIDFEELRRAEAKPSRGAR